MNSTAVRCVDVTKSFGRTVAVQAVSLEVENGKFLALLGPSGCGKTTSLRLIAGFLRPDSGAIWVGGQLVASGHVFVPPEKRGIGMVFQDYALFPHLTVAQNVAFGVREKAARPLRVQELLETVGLAGLDRRYPHELSGGQQQRVALARALAPQPPIILMDEPFSNLDADLRAQVRREVREILKRTGTAAIFVTHDQEESLALADSVAVLHQGRLEQTGTPDEIYHRPATRFVADFVGQADFVPARVTANGVASELGSLALPVPLDVGEQVELMIRPHDVGLAADARGPAVVTAREFHGEENHYTVRLASGREVHSTLASHTVFQLGDRVTVSVCIPEVVVFRGDEALGRSKAQASQAAARRGQGPT